MLVIPKSIADMANSKSLARFHGSEAGSPPESFQP